jgi:hypothetical protein
MEPRVCVPSASRTIPAATAAADPLDEPPGVCARFQGFTVGPGWRQANSVVTVLPSTVPPKSLIFETIQASVSGTCPANTGDPFSVGIPAVAIMSLIPTGTPSSGPRWPHLAGFAICRNACSQGSTASARAIAVVIGASGCMWPV